MTYLDHQSGRDFVLVDAMELWETVADNLLCYIDVANECNMVPPANGPTIYVTY